MPPSGSVDLAVVNDDESHGDHAMNDLRSSVELGGNEMATGQVSRRDSSSEYNEQHEANNEALIQQIPRHQVAAIGNGGNMYPQHAHQQPAGPIRVPSSASVGSTGSNHRSNTDSFNNGSSLNTRGNASYPFSNPYDPKFLAAAAAAYHQQQLNQPRASNSESGVSGITQQHASIEEYEGNNKNALLWKLVQDKEDELKEVRKILRETQQKFQEQSLLATKLQTTLDQLHEAFEKERLLIQLQAEKKAQEALTLRQEEIFQKQLKWMEDTVRNTNFDACNQNQKEIASIAIADGNGNSVTNDRATDKLPDKNGSNVKSDNLISRSMVSEDEEYEKSQNNESDANIKKVFQIPSNTNNKDKLYPSINESLNGNSFIEHGNTSDNAYIGQGQNAAQNDGLSNKTSLLGAAKTTMGNNGSSIKVSMNESMSSDRFDPVYVAQNADKDEDMAKDATYSTNDDDKSLGQTVASSTYGDDRVKVVNKKLLDPYGDKGTYTGIVLRNTGMPHGLGRMVYEEDQRVFEGDWRHGRWHGYGRASFSNGDSYEGEYKFDQRHGTGVYRWNDGRVYDGQFSEDKRHGKGIFTWPDGAVYDGDFVNGQRQGHGKYTFADGGQYEGSWKDGRYDGFGTCTWEDGRRYRGEWRNGMAHGRGTETYPNGNIRHEGEWIDDEPIR